MLGEGRGFYWIANHFLQLGYSRGASFSGALLLLFPPCGLAFLLFSFCCLMRGDKRSLTACHLLLVVVCTLSLHYPLCLSVLSSISPRVLLHAFRHQHCSAPSARCCSSRGCCLPFSLRVPPCIPDALSLCFSFGSFPASFVVPPLSPNFGHTADSNTADARRSTTRSEAVYCG